MEALGKPMMYRNLREIVDPEHTALVAFHVQNGLVSPVFNREKFLHNLKLLIEAARKNKIPIIYSKIAPLPRHYESPWRIYMIAKRFGVDDPEKLKMPPHLQPGSPESQIHSSVTPMEDDVIIDHHTLSIFMGTHFEYMMRNKGINTIMFTGVSTEVGIDSSARSSSDRGFYTIVVEDCVSTNDKEMHESALKTLRGVCLVIPSNEIMKEWK